MWRFAGLYKKVLSHTQMLAYNQDYTYYSQSSYAITLSLVITAYKAFKRLPQQYTGSKSFKSQLSYEGHQINLQAPLDL